MISARGVNTVCMVEMNYQFSFSLVLYFYSTLWKPEVKSLKNNEHWQRLHACIQCKQVDLLPTT